MAFVFEACVDGPISAIQAQEGGAGRLELCAALSLGESLQAMEVMIRAVLDSVHIPVHVLIRPRAGDFCYKSNEIDAILEDIRMVGKLKAHGIAFGALTTDGDIDIRLMEMAMSICKMYNLSMTFHRAFDATRDPERSLQTLIKLGVPRVLTSGQKQSVMEGLPLLKFFVNKSTGRISIMPGGGVREDNAASIVRALGVAELHGSASSLAPFGRDFVNGTIAAAFGTATLTVTQSNKVRCIVQACLNAIHNSSS